MTGIELIKIERERQIHQEGWSESHDDQHIDNELARLAGLYALPEKYRDIYNTYPLSWNIKYWKPTPNNRIKELIKAGALIAAEIDRLQRIVH